MILLKFFEKLPQRLRQAHLPPENDLSTLVANHAEGIFALRDDTIVLEKLLAGGSFPSGRLGLLITRPGDLALEASRREFGKWLRVRPVADIDGVFLEEADLPLHLLQVAVRQGKLIAKLAGSAEVESGERWLRGPVETAALFVDSSEAVRTALALADECQFTFGNLRPEPPAGEISGGEQAQERLRRLCMEAITARSEKRAMEQRARRPTGKRAGNI